MNQQIKQELERLFSQFANETQASSFATENLLNKTLRIVQKIEQKQQSE